MSKLYAYADLPRTGLCNMLNVWARAYLWAKDHHAKMLAPKWVQILRVGPLIRGERDKRLYLNQFANKGMVCGLRRLLVLLFSKRFGEDVAEGVSRGVVVFSGQKRDLLDVCGRREELREELERQAVPQIKNRLAELPPVYVAVHIRYGDFKTIGRTLPPEYYVRAIQQAAQRIVNVPILVFSDAHSWELAFLKGLGESVCRRIRHMKSNSALHDVLALSKANLLICTNGSSFSEWAACLGGMPTIWSKDGIGVVREKFSGDITLI